MLKMLRDVSDVSDHLDMSGWSGVSLTCLQQFVHVVQIQFGQLHDKRVALPVAD